MPGPIRKILIIDDESDLIKPLAMRLSAGGQFEVATAFDSGDGLRKALFSPPDLALIDLSMPVMDGWELCRRLRGNPSTRHTRIVIMTASVSRDLHTRAGMEGAAKVLMKPFEDAELWAAVSPDPAGADAPEEEA